MRVFKATDHDMLSGVLGFSFQCSQVGHLPQEPRQGGEVIVMTYYSENGHRSVIL